ncbi:MAG: hypothetical protein ACJAXH_002006 [Colwellia sp.]
MSKRFVINTGVIRALLGKFAYGLIKLFVKLKLLFSILPLDSNLVYNTAIKYLIQSSSDKEYSVNDTRKKFILLLLITTGIFSSFSLLAHGVDDVTKQFLEANEGGAIFPFIYIGAKHMLTGYDHLLFLVGVVFFLFRSKDVLLYVSLFTLGHSLTLLYGVFSQIDINAYIIDAIIGLSVVYKGFDNLGGFQRLFNYQPNTKIAVTVFGLFHGFGLATKIQEFQLPSNGLVSNIISFNLGVEIGQILALAMVLIVLSFWRKHSSYLSFATFTNTALISAGFMLIGLQLTGYFIS